MRFAGPRLDGDEAAGWLVIGWEYDAAGNTNRNGDMEMEIATASSIWTFFRWTGLTGSFCRSRDGAAAAAAAAV